MNGKTILWNSAGFSINEFPFVYQPVIQPSPEGKIMYGDIVVTKFVDKDFQNNTYIIDHIFDSIGSDGYITRKIALTRRR